MSTDDDAAFWRDAHALVDADRVKAEARARRAEEQSAKMSEIVQAVTTGEIGDMGYNLAGYCRCDPDLVEHLADDGEWLSTEVVHKPHCLIAKAQALLANERERRHGGMNYHIVPGTLNLNGVDTPVWVVWSGDMREICACFKEEQAEYVRHALEVYEDPSKLANT